MRIVLVALLAVGCLQGCLQDPGSDPTWTNPPPTPSGGGGGFGYACHQDAECGTGDVCARDGECLPSDEVRVAHVTWTVNGQAADTATCGDDANLELDFYSGADSYGYAPVPCVEGKFTVDKLPVWYSSVELSRAGDQGGSVYGTLDRDSGEAVLDLRF